MSKSPVAKHIHKVKRQRFKSGNVSFFCTLPDCYFKMNPALMLGKKTICWRCGNEFIMNEYSIRLAKPHCENCHKPKSETFPESTIEQLNKEWIHEPNPVELQASQSLSERMANLFNKPANQTVATEEDEDI